MRTFCENVCVNKTSEGYCKTTACINPKYSQLWHSQLWHTSVPAEDKKGDTVAVRSKIIRDIAPTDTPITNIEISGEKVFQVYKDGNWEIERVFTEYKSPVDKLVVVMSRKEKKDDDA